MVSYIYATIPRNAIIRLSHSRSRDSQARKRFQYTLLTFESATMTPTAQITFSPNRHKAFRLSHSRIKRFYIYIYTYIYGIQNQKQFLSSTFRHLSFSRLIYIQVTFEKSFYNFLCYN